jgi:hypothetical protein
MGQLAVSIVTAALDRTVNMIAQANVDDLEK